MYGVNLTGRVITKDEDIPCRLMVNPTFYNEGTADVVIFGFHKIPAGKSDRITSSSFPILNETISVRFSNTGTKKLSMSYGTLGKIPCENL